MRKRKGNAQPRTSGVFHIRKFSWCRGLVPLPWALVGILSVDVREVLGMPPWYMLWAFGTALVPC